MIDTLFAKLAEQGVVAVLLALSIIANYFQYQQYTRIQEQRIKDAELVRDSINEPMSRIEGLLQSLLLIIQGKKP